MIVLYNPNFISPYIDIIINACVTVLPIPNIFFWLWNLGKMSLIAHEYELTYMLKTAHSHQIMWILDQQKMLKITKNKVSVHNLYYIRKVKMKNCNRSAVNIILK